MSITVNHYDIAIVGQGLAGTALAWALHWAGLRVVIIDRDEPITSSKIAAGLITPVTGMRLVKTENFDEYIAQCVQFYRRLEQELQTVFFHEVSMLRILADETERDLFLNKRLEEYRGLIEPADDAINPAYHNCNWGAFQMHKSARLDVARFLGASRARFRREDHYRVADIHPQRDLMFERNQIQIPKLNLQSDRLIFCEGFAAMNNPWFQSLPFDSAKGEILTVRIPLLKEQRIIHRGIWLAPVAGDTFRIGATYDRDHWDPVPTASGRAELLDKLQSFLSADVEVLEHHAAVRPVIIGRRVALGFHPKQHQIGCFNGLGSKGALLAPWHALHFADVIAGNAIMKPACDAVRYFQAMQNGSDR